MEKELEDKLNRLTNNRISSLSSCTVNTQFFLQSRGYYKVLYRCYEITTADGFTIFILDIVEKEQPDITDTTPTNNPGFTEVGVLLNNGHIYKIY